MNFTRLKGVASTPGLVRLLACALLADLPAGMAPLAIVLRITEAGGTYARAGLMSGVTALGVGISAPLWSRLVDRRGQLAGLLPTAVAVTASALFLAALPPRGPLLPLLVASALMGLTQPPALVCARTLWPLIVNDRLLLETTYSVESAMTELVFIAGPLLAVIVAAVLTPASAVAGSGLLAGVGTLGFATSNASRQARGHRTKATRHGALRSRSVQVLVLAIFAMVLAFATIDVSTVAAARRYGSNGAAAAMIAIWSIGSLVGGLAFGIRSWPGRRSTKIVCFITAIAVLTGALVPLSNLSALSTVLFIGGLFYAPSFSCINQIVQRTAIAGATTESFAWIAAGTLAGSSLGSTAGGFAITRHGFRAGYGVATCALVLAVSILCAGRRALRDGDDERIAASGQTPVEIAGSAHAGA